MKINIFNRDRKGGHKLSPLVDGLGTIYAPSPTVRKIAKQITGRKARRVNMLKQLSVSLSCGMLIVKNSVHAIHGMWNSGIV